MSVALANRIIDLDAIHDGQVGLANGIRRMVYWTSPELFAALAAEDDAPFLEPLLFAAFAAGDAKDVVPGLLVGYLPEHGRPSACTVHSDARGRVYIPGIGTFATSRPDSTLLLHPQGPPRNWHLRWHGEPASRAYSPERHVGSTTVRLLHAHHPLLNRLYVDEANHGVDVREPPADRYAVPLENALDAVGRAFPRYHEALLHVTRGIVCFSGDEPNSFAAMGAYGVAFFNLGHLRGGDAEVFCVEDLAHQCGHIVFSAMAQGGEGYFVVDPSTRLRDVVEDVNDDRSLYVTLHGVFTEAVMSVVLKRCLEDGGYDPARARELRGRLAFILHRFLLDLRNLDVDSVFTPTGRALLESLHDVFDAVRDDAAEAIRGLDLSGQPYVFDFGRFSEANR